MTGIWVAGGSRMIQPRQIRNEGRGCNVFYLFFLYFFCFWCELVFFPFFLRFRKCSRFSVVCTDFSLVSVSLPRFLLCFSWLYCSLTGCLRFSAGFWILFLFSQWVSSISLVAVTCCFIRWFAAIDPIHA